MQTAKPTLRPTPITRREKVARKAESIVAAARTIFLGKGFAGTTMAEIARKSGVADGTLYLYFQNKDALARAVVADFYRRLTESAQAGVDGLTTVPERLRFLALHHLRSLMDEQRILEILPVINTSIEAYEGSALFELNKNYVAIFDRIAKDGQAMGVVKPELSPWVLRDIVFGALDYGFKTMTVKRRQQDMEQFVDALLALILTDIRNPPSTGPQPDMLGVTRRLERAAARIETALEEIS